MRLSAAQVPVPSRHGVSNPGGPVPLLALVRDPRAPVRLQFGTHRGPDPARSRPEAARGGKRSALRPGSRAPSGTPGVGSPAGSRGPAPARVRHPDRPPECCPGTSARPCPARAWSSHTNALRPASLPRSRNKGNGHLPPRYLLEPPRRPAGRWPQRLGASRRAARRPVLLAGSRACRRAPSRQPSQSPPSPSGPRVTWPQRPNKAARFRGHQGRRWGAGPPRATRWRPELENTETEARWQGH